MLLVIPMLIVIFLIRLFFSAKERDGRSVTYLIAAALGAVVGFLIGTTIFGGPIGQDFAEALDTAYRDDHGPWWPVLAQFFMAFMTYGGLAILVLFFISGDNKPRPILSLSPAVVGMGLTAALIAACWAAKLNTAEWVAQLPG